MSLVSYHHIYMVSNFLKLFRDFIRSLKKCAFRLDRVSIAPSMSDADTVTDEQSPTSTFARHVPANSTVEALAEESQKADEDVSAKVADTVAAGEEAVQEEGDQREAGKRAAEPPIPSLITSNMFVCD